MPFNGVGASNTELSVGYLSFAVHAMQELAAANPALQSVGYDDGCHLAELLRRHPDPRLRALDVWIDLFHLYGHVRSKCFLHHNPLTRLTADDRVSVTVTSEACRKRLLSHLDGYGKVLRHRSLQARFGWLWQSGPWSFDAAVFCRQCFLLCCLPSLSRICCCSFADQSRNSTPCPCDCYDADDHRVQNASAFLERTRHSLWQALSRHSNPKSSVAAPLRIHCVVTSCSRSRPSCHQALCSARIDLVDRLARSTLPFVVTFLYGLNTSIAEENWVHFNKFRHTMRAMGRAEYLLFAHRVAHLRNTQMVARRS